LEVAQQIPKWIHSYNAWNDFIYGNCNGGSSHQNEDVINNISNNNDKGEKGEKSDYEEDGYDDDASKDYIVKEEDEEEEEEEEEEDKEEEEEEEGKVEEEEEEMDDDSDIKIPIKQDEDKCNSVSALKKKMSPVKNEKKTDDDLFDVITEGDLKNKKSQHVAKTVKSNSEDENEFKSICCGNLRKKIAENYTIKSNLVNIHITGPFFNKKSGQSHWVVEYGDSGKSYALKPRFIWKYLSCLLLDWEKVKKKVKIDHCYMHYEIGI
jgi:hypothetical protein